MKKKIVSIFVIGLIFVITAILFIYKKDKQDMSVSKKQTYIDTVLSQKEYAYLPNEAKNYIRLNYEETGEIILTEKNKEN